jgi:hypothetical protein
MLKPTKGTAAMKKAIENMKKFVIFGWAIYPIGTAIQEFLELSGSDVKNIELAVCLAAIIYVFADVINKVGFGVVALKALKKYFKSKWPSRKLGGHFLIQEFCLLLQRLCPY